MTYKQYNDVSAFYNDTKDTLAKHEAQNSLPLGNAKRGADGVIADTSEWFMATVSGDIGNIVLIAVMTPPFNITLYETNNVQNEEALRCLIENIMKNNISVPGIIAENSLAKRFASAYAEMTSGSFTEHEKLCIYTLTEIDKTVPQIGKLRLAENKDLSFLPYWIKGFNDDCFANGQEIQTSYEKALHTIETKNLFILEDGGVAVSMACMSRETPNGRCIGLVYTPPYFRNKGYASSCTAQVSQKILDIGYTYAMLFADLANPVSNSIYQKMGYKHECDMKDIRLHDYLKF